MKRTILSSDIKVENINSAYPIKYIDKETISKKIKVLKHKGITQESRNPRLIVSLTSFPERMYDIHYCLYSLLNQTIKPDAVVLWLAEEQFPNKEKDVPREVLHLFQNGLTIKWCENIGSYKKLIPSLREYPNDIVVTADDDIYYPENWLALLYNSYVQEPTYIHCHRAHRIKFTNDGSVDKYDEWEKEVVGGIHSFLNFSTGSGGCLYPQKSLYKDVVVQDLFMDLCPAADDVWFWAMAVLTGTKIKVINNNISSLTYINPERELRLNQERTLSQLNVLENKNDEQINNVLNYYKELKKKICFNSAEYWERRYYTKGNSGAGSYGRLAQFKADIINNFIKENNIETVIEFGCGDGNQLSLLNCKQYTGVDVSKTILAETSAKFASDTTKQFIWLKEFNDEKADLCLSLDVIYHLIEDDIFEDYMNRLFSSSKRYVIIYSSDKNEFHVEHVKHRNFTQWISDNKPDWGMTKHIPNLYPSDNNDQNNTSFCDFYIYERGKIELDIKKLSTQLIRNFVKSKDLFVDVGAGLGVYSVLAAESNKKIRIIAIEPIEENFEVLNKNFVHNNIGAERAKCINAAVSSSTGKIKLYKSKASGNKNIFPQPNSTTLEQLEVNAVSLDDVLKDEQYKSLFIKTDTDGNELEVLKGLSSTFATCDDITILLEMNPKLFRLAGTSCKEMIDYLTSKDFNVYGINDQESKYYPLEVAGNLEILETEHSFFNALCIKKEKSLSVAFFSHSSVLAGAERSLADLVEDLCNDSVLCSVLLPSDGPLKDMLLDKGAAVYIVPNAECWWVDNKNYFNKENRKLRIAQAMMATVTRSLPILRQLKPDVIFTQTIVAPWGALCAEILSIPHALSVCEYGELDHPFIFYFGFRESIKALYDSSQAIFSITKSVKNEVFKGISDKDSKIEVVYRSVRLAPNDALNITPQNYDYENKSEIKIAIFGTVHEGKGQEDIVRAGLELMKKGRKVKIYILGSSEPHYSAFIKDLIEASIYKENFIIKDFVNDPIEQMKEMDIVVSCSRNEALGRTLFEAILLDKPIVYSDSGGPKEIFTDEEHGLAYQCADEYSLYEKLLFVMDHPDKTRQRVKIAKEYVLKNFNPENYSGKIESRLKQIKGTPIKPCRSVQELFGIDFLVEALQGEFERKDTELAATRNELTEKVAERDGQIANLNQTVVGLNQTIAECDHALSSLTDELGRIKSSRSWKLTMPLRFIKENFERVLNKIKYFKNIVVTPIKHNGGIINTIKKWLKIFMIEGLRGGIIQFKKQVYNAINSSEELGSIAIKRDVPFSDAFVTGMKKDKITFYSSTSILFVGHDALLAGAPVLLLSLIKWFSQHTGIVIKIILLRDGILLDKFRIIAPTLVWEDLVLKFPDKEKRKAQLIKFVGKVDLIYGNTVLAPSIYDELEFLKVPYITHVHELEKSIKMYFDKNTIEKMHLYTNGYIAGSNPVELNLIKNHNIDQQEIITINDFIGKREINFAISKKDLRKKLGLIEEGLIVFGCGTMYWRKGVDLFIETALILKQKGHSNFHFYWIGENIWDLDHASHRICTWNELEHKILDSGLKNHITFLGVKENFFDYFLAGDIFYLPSREDPFPLVCLEAAQCSLPVICFEDAGGMPSFVEDDAGFVVPDEDVNEVVEKIISLDNNHDLLNELGATARRKFLLRHSLDIAAPEILSYCRKVGNLHPAVSVIVPNYNYEKYLEKRLDSILNQTFKDFELILLDDASTDQSLDVIEKYLNYPNVRLFKNNINSGNTFRQWHKGLSEAKGEILWFAEADDFCESNFLQKLLPSFNNASVALAYSDSLIVDESDKVTGNYVSDVINLDAHHWKSSYQVTASQEINFGLGVKNSIPNASAVLIRKSCVSEAIFNETFQFKFSGDWFFYTQVIKGKDIAFCSEKINYHRKHNQTVTSKSMTDASASELLLKEAGLIHNIILKNYSIDDNFIEKWQLHMAVHIRSFHPNTSKEEFNRYYPYNLIEEKIKNAIAKNIRLVFLTTNNEAPNGGSEQLWIETAIECRKRGHNVMIVIKNWDPVPYFIQIFNNIGIKVLFKGNDDFNQMLLFNPDLLVVSTGDMDEGIEWYDACQKHNIPYVIINQLTKEPEYWPIKSDINEQVKNGYLGAARVFFTCNNNHKVMEKRLNCQIPNASIHYNPFHVDRNSFVPFPSMDDGLKIAIPANLSRVHKGQHLAIELFNQKKWRARSIQLNLYGAGYDEEVLKTMAKKYGLEKVFFHKHTHDMLTIWRDNHAIFMPSFMEGLPLVLVGAMICARVPILTDIGAHREVVDDNINGFIAIKPTVEALDEALERAYQKSAMWEEIGQKAREKILSIIPDDPVDDFISKIIPFTNKKHS